MRFILLVPLFLACENTVKVGVDDNSDALIQADADADGYLEDEDCDDSDPSIHPGATEVCDSIDNNCNDEVDEGVSSLFYLDTDNDGFGTEADTIQACDAPEGYVPNGNDCDDSNAEIFPSAPEICDDVDNDCDTFIDEDLTGVWYADLDNDGFGDQSTIETTCLAPENYVDNDLDCNDENAEINPNMEEICDEIDNNCDDEIDEGVTSQFFVDADHDGFGDDSSLANACELGEGLSLIGGDCDDIDALINPDAEEICDEVDNDCNGETDENSANGAQTWYFDSDQDGYGDSNISQIACEQPVNYVLTADDCDDSDPSIFPNAPELCDGLINDCNTATLPSDEQDIDADGVSECAGDCDDSEPDYQTPQDWYADLDTDGFGDVNNTALSCLPQAGFVSDNTDCDDSESSIFPNAPELCDGLINDCNTATLPSDEQDIDADGVSECDGDCDDSNPDYQMVQDWYHDSDLDGYGNANSSFSACIPPAGYVLDDSDCNDSSPEYNLIRDWYFDSDGDGFGDINATYSSCSPPSGHVADNTDCNDSEGTVFPSAPEICDALDNDCDGNIPVDEIDQDGDSFSICAGDCDESSADIHPNATEICNGIDDDCDGSFSVDEIDDDGDGFSECDGDCDDSDPEFYPNATEVCHGEDLNCDTIDPPLCSSCLEIKQVGSDDGDGLYTVDSTHEGEIEVYCDMTQAGGGWTLVQRTVWDWSESILLLTTYSGFYNNSIGDPNTDQPYRLSAQMWDELNVELDHMLAHTPRDNSNGADCGTLYYTGSDGLFSVSPTGLSISGFSSNVSFFADNTFDAYGTTCPSGYNAVPWFYTHCCSTCPTFGGTYWSSPHPMAYYPDYVPDINGNTSNLTCPSGTAIGTSSHGYEGMNAMEYYLR